LGSVPFLGLIPPSTWGTGREGRKRGWTRVGGEERGEEVKGYKEEERRGEGENGVMEGKWEEGDGRKGRGMEVRNAGCGQVAHEMKISFPATVYGMHNPPHVYIKYTQFPSSSLKYTQPPFNRTNKITQINTHTHTHTRTVPHPISAPQPSPPFPS
jgi:hypothetical protein